MRRSLLVLALLALTAPLAFADRAPWVPELRVHEWGVWKMKDGEVTHLADLQREVPSFVRQTRAQAWTGSGMIARKPILYAYTSQPIDLDIEVSFRGGGPWLFYPGVQAMPCGQGVAREISARDMPARRGPMACQPDRLQWHVRAVPNARAQLAAVDARHFWNHLRSVPSSLLLAPDGTAEKFLFYDGPVTFPRAWRAGRGQFGERTFTRVGPASTGPLIVAWGNRWVPVPANGVGSGMGISTTSPWPVPPRPIADEIHARLRAAGLTPAEARSLVETWRPEIEAPGLRAFWLLPRAEYDALLPLRISPMPREIVRVGLVIEDLS